MVIMKAFFRSVDKNIIIAKYTTHRLEFKQVHPLLNIENASFINNVIYVKVFIDQIQN